MREDLKSKNLKGTQKIVSVYLQPPMMQLKEKKYVRSPFASETKAKNTSPTDDCKLYRAENNLKVHTKLRNTYGNPPKNINDLTERKSLRKES